MSEKPQVILDLEIDLGITIQLYQLNDKNEVIFINLSNTQITDIRPLAKLTNLSTLHLSSTQITDISPLAELTNLSTLYLFNTQNTDISPLAGLTNLSFLYLFNLQIKDISPLAGLTNLSTLNLSSTKIKDISPLAGLKKLFTLNLSSTQITDISPLAGLKKLSSLYLNYNKITDINSLAGLTNLSSLFLKYTKIMDISPLAGLTNLSSLHLSYTQITDISPLAGLTNLSSLYLYDTKITDISPLVNLVNWNIQTEEFKDEFTGNTLNLFGFTIEQEVINAVKSGGKRALIKYLESKKRGKIRIPEAKMVLLGEPRSGKTTLQKYLMGLPINENEESTPDIQISSWKPFENDSEDKNSDIKINLWDFGGQEIQYSLHKLFMTEDTLYIIVLDSTKDQSPLKYLKFLENYAPNSPFIIINNYGDAPTSNTLKIDENYLRENYNGKDGMPVLKAIFNRVSVLKAAKLEPSFRKIMDEVEATIKNELLNLKNLNKEFPKEYQLDNFLN